VPEEKTLQLATIVKACQAMALCLWYAVPGSLHMYAGNTDMLPCFLGKADSQSAAAHL